MIMEKNRDIGRGNGDRYSNNDNIENNKEKTW